MPAAVCRTRPARSISLWLTIWASAGLSLRTGRKARDQRIARALAAIDRRWQPREMPLAAVAPPTQPQHKSNLGQFPAVTRALARAYSPLSERAGPWVGFGVWLSDWGRSPQRHPRGLTSNRHARRPDRWPIRAFAFGHSL